MSCVSTDISPELIRGDIAFVYSAKAVSIHSVAFFACAAIDAADRRQTQRIVDAKFIGLTSSSGRYGGTLTLRLARPSRLEGFESQFPKVVMQPRRAGVDVINDDASLLLMRDLVRLANVRIGVDQTRN